jgi:hypothetical protein
LLGGSKVEDFEVMSDNLMYTKYVVKFSQEGEEEDGDDGDGLLLSMSDCRGGTW